MRVIHPRYRLVAFGILFSHPTERFHLRQMERLARTGVGAVQRELKSLTSAGIAVQEREGSHTFYRANADSPLFAPMKELVLKPVGIAPLIRTAIEPLREKIQAA